MKYHLFIFSLLFILLSCKDAEDKQQEKEPSQQPDQRESPMDRDDRLTRQSETTSRKDSTAGGSGSAEKKMKYTNMVFVKDDQEDPDCSCYCIEISGSGETELCLKDGSIYVRARVSSNNGIAQLYYSGPSERTNTTEKEEELPWEEFDTDQPIAEMTPTPNGGMELDWKGFSIGQELAVDYAIYGKKTLEGRYRKQ